MERLFSFPSRSRSFSSFKAGWTRAERLGCWGLVGPGHRISCWFFFTFFFFSPTTRNIIRCPVYPAAGALGLLVSADADRKTPGCECGTPRVCCLQFWPAALNPPLGPPPPACGSSDARVFLRRQKTGRIFRGRHWKLRIRARKIILRPDYAGGRLGAIPYRGLFEF